VVEPFEAVVRAQVARGGGVQVPECEGKAVPCGLMVGGD
jgi:hypothetical protein